MKRLGDALIDLGITTIGCALLLGGSIVIGLHLR
jgi:hypothetical protein